MNDKSLNILFTPDIPQDLFALMKNVPVYDVKNETTTGKEIVYPIPYNANEGMWITAPLLKAERYIFQKLIEEDYSVWKPILDGEYLSLLASKNGKRFLFVLVLESEDEKNVWRALELSNKYEIVVVRDRIVKEEPLVIGTTIDEVFDSLKFLTV